MRVYDVVAVAAVVFLSSLGNAAAALELSPPEPPVVEATTPQLAAMTKATKTLNQRFLRSGKTAPHENAEDEIRVDAEDGEERER